MTSDGVVHIEERYYDTPRFDLLQQAVFVCVRNDQRLEFKFNEQGDTAHRQSTKRVFPLFPYPARGENTSQALALLHKFIADLDVQPIKVEYVKLWLRIHTPQAYQLGKHYL